MALIEYDVYKQKLRDLEPELKKLGDALDIDADHPVRDGPGGGG